MNKNIYILKRYIISYKFFNLKVYIFNLNFNLKSLIVKSYVVF